MAFKLTDAGWLQGNAPLAANVFKKELEHDVEYTPVELNAILTARGYSYAEPEWNLIRDELVRSGVLVETEDEPE